jgi:hypothetical protein
LCDVEPTADCLLKTQLDQTEVGTREVAVKARRANEQPRQLMFEIENLGLPSPLKVGRTRFLPTSAAQAELRHRAGGAAENRVLEQQVGGVVEGGRSTCIDDALETVRMSVAVLRLFVAGRRFGRHTHFGLPGEVRHGFVKYLSVDSAVGAGFCAWGNHPGFDFEEVEAQEFRDSAEFQFVSDAIRNPSPSDAERRARTGAWIFGRAVLEPDPDLKEQQCIAALET